MATVPTQQYREFAVSTSLDENVLLFYSLRGAEQLGRLFRYDLELLSEQPDIDLDEVIGESITVRINLGDGKSRYFNGVVSRFAQVGELGEYARYEATLVPWLWFLTRTADCRIFQFDKMTVPKIIQKVFETYGFAGLVEDQLSGNYREWSYCVQYRETAFNFVSRLMENEGIYYYFKHESDKHKLVLADSEGSHGPFPDYDTLAFQPTPSTTGDPFIQSWSFGRHIQPGIYTQNDYDFTNPRKLLKTSKPIQRGHANAGFEIYDFPGAYTEYKDGENYSRVRIEELQAQHEIYHGSSFTRGIVNGCLFELVEHPRNDQNQKYLITGVTHEIVGDPYQSVGEVGRSELSCSLTAIKSSQPFRPARITPKPVIQGPQTATVVGPDGEEMHTDKYGRIKVKFHWDRYFENADKSACWIRVAQVWAGNQWGSMTIPRVGQEVMVEFREGDPDHPIVTGRVYNNDQMPPYTASGSESVNGNISGLKSRTTPGGGGYNELIMDDTKGKEQIRIHGQYDMSTTVEHDQSLTVKNDRTVTVNGKLTETITKDTKITIESGTYTHKVAANKASYHVHGDLDETYAAKQTTKVTSTIDYSSDADINVTAKSHIVLNVGASTLKMDSAGNIDLTGVKIKIHGSDLVHSDGAKVLATGGTEAKMGVGNQNVSCDPTKVAVSGAAINSSAVGTHEITGAVVKIN